MKKEPGCFPRRERHRLRSLTGLVASQVRVVSGKATSGRPPGPVEQLDARVSLERAGRAGNVFEGEVHAAFSSHRSV